MRLQRLSLQVNLSCKITHRLLNVLVTGWHWSHVNKVFTSADFIYASKIIINGVVFFGDYHAEQNMQVS